MTATEPVGAPQAGPAGTASTAGPRAVVPALDRGMRVLQLLAESPQRAYALSEIAQLLGIPKSTAFNICGALAEGQLLRRVRDGFQLGRGLLELGSAYASSVNVVAEFYDVCRDAPPDLGAVIQLAVLDEDLQAVYLAHQDCGSGLRLGLGGMVGRRVPANCTAGGKMLLALLPPAELEEHTPSSQAGQRLLEYLDLDVPLQQRQSRDQAGNAGACDQDFRLRLRSHARG